MDPAVTRHAQAGMQQRAIRADALQRGQKPFITSSSTSLPELCRGMARTMHGEKIGDGIILSREFNTLGGSHDGFGAIGVGRGRRD